MRAETGISDSIRDPCLDPLRSAFEGVLASVICTCDADGVPNVSLISQVHFVDDRHVALSYQFFNKTRRNLMATRAASVMVFDTETFAQYRLALEYQQTLTSGPIFETMKAKLAGIASLHGMEQIFRLLGSDIFLVQAIEPVVEPLRQPVPALPSRLGRTRRIMADLDRCTDLEELVETLVQGLERDMGIAHSMLWIRDAGAGRLYLVGSRGYAVSGVGAEISLGQGVIGVAARENTPIRIGHFSHDYSYGATVSETARRAGLIGEGRCGIAFPGLAQPASQIAVPIAEGGEVSGVIFAESLTSMRFSYEDEDALAILAAHLALRMQLIRAENDEETAQVAAPENPATGQVVLRYFAGDQSVFLGQDYLIKGVAGAILWRLVRDYAATGRTEFSTRELRLDQTLRLPIHSENLDARLILLRRRLEDRDACLRLEKAGRGRFRLQVNCQLALDDSEGAPTGA